MNRLFIYTRQCFFPVILFLLMFIIVTLDLAHSQMRESADSFILSEAQRKEKLAKRMLAGAKNITANQLMYDIHYYRLQLQIDVENEHLQGVLSLKASALDSLNYMELNLLDEMHVDSVFFEQQKIDHHHLDDLIKAEFLRPIPKDSIIDLTVYYNGNPENGTNLHFGFDTFQDKPMIWSLSEPYGARTWWPCKDYPSDKADSVDLFITVPQDLIVASNGKLQGIDSLQSMHTYHYHEQYPIATYLVSLAIHPYFNYVDWYINSNGDSVKIDFYVFSEHLQYLENNYAKTAEMMSVFSLLYGEYPFSEEKYGHAEFLWGGGMEHQTISSLGYWGESLIAHELSHQWWGNMVTCRNFHHIWLNEGFATYSEALWQEHLGGQEALKQWMNYRRFLGEGTVYVEDPLNDNIFDYELSYAKGAWVLHMLRHKVGDQTFFNILNEYRRRYFLQTTVTKDFKNVCEAVSGMDLEQFFQQWIYESGYPFYRYVWKTREMTNGNTHLSVLIHQVQDNVVFSMPIDIQLEFASSDSLFVVENNHKTQLYEFILTKKPENVRLDPNHWILRRQQNPNVTDIKPVRIKLSDKHGKDLIHIMPGEMAYFNLQLYNQGIDLGNAFGMLKTDNVFVHIEPDSVYFGKVAAQDTIAEQSMPFSIGVSTTARSGIVDCELWLINENDIPVFPVPVRFYIGPSEVVLVNDTPDAESNEYFDDLFKQFHLTYAVWENSLRGLAPTRHDAPLWIWYTGSDSQTSLTSDEQNLLFPIIERENDLLLIGSNIGSDLVKDGTYLDSLFYYHVLRAEFKAESAVSNILAWNF